MSARTCSVEGCDREFHAHGYCEVHYRRVRREGITDLRPVPSVAERIASRCTEQFNGCLVWKGATVDGGYGRIQLNKKSSLLHRVAWELVNGPIPDGMVVCHTCDNPPCVNVAHLFLGTQLDNLADMRAKGRGRSGGNEKKTHCPQGHPYDALNTYVSPSGSRSCRICASARRKRRVMA